VPETASIEATMMDDHPLWGACVFLRGSGEAEAIRDEYAARADGWPSLHFAIVEPPTDEALDPWYRLGFAHMHAYGVRESGGERISTPGIEIRRGGPDDLETALAIDRLIHESQAAAPSYSAEPLDEEQRRRDWIETLAGDDVRYFVAQREDGEAVGHLTLYDDPHDDEALHIASTAVLPSARGRGIGLALTTHALALAAEDGRPRVWTNWRVTNLVASRYWPARGFRLARLRLVRRLPEL
jgi:ribosomal protein S18 acetylase RimI-like enzyme